MTEPVGVVVVTWQSAETIGACLTSIPSGVPVVVVDNDSSDGTLERVRDARPAAVRVPAGTNLGFGAACNLGASRLPDHDLLFLNPDAALGPGTLEALQGKLRTSPAIGAVGPRVVGADGRPEWSWGEDPTVRGEFARSRRVRRGMVPPVPEGAVDWVTGGCCLVRREAWAAVTGFDPGYFLYFEDLDLCRRIRQAGFTVHVVPEVEATHVRGHSSAQASQAVKRHYRESQSRYYSTYGSGLDRAIVALYARWRAAR